jgi:hypothetical protein
LTLDGSDSIIINEAAQLEIPCVARGRPTPTTVWMRDGRPMLLSTAEYQVHVGDDRKREHVVAQPDGRITIYEVSSADAGLYTCTASNAAGQDTKAVRVTVHGTLTNECSPT